MFGIIWQSATKGDLESFATKGDLEKFATKEDLHEFESRLSAKIYSVKDMLEDDAKAESKRLDRVDRRSLGTLRMLKARKADSAAHGAASGR
jgi:hypothetical protein